MVSFLPAAVDRRWALKKRKAWDTNLPSPVLGLNARDGLTSMKPHDAIGLTNVFPEATECAVRGGSVVASSGGGMSGAVRSLMTWNGLTGVDKLFAGNGTSIYDVNGATASVTTITGLANVDFQWTNIKTPGGIFLMVVNGADTMKSYDGTNWAVPAVTVANSATFANVTQFKERLWFSQVDSLDVWYLPVQSIAGAATVFPLGAVFHRGGYVIGMGTFSNDAGEGPDDYLCFVSSNGEVAVYAGTDPASVNTFALMGRFDVGMPIGRRCTIRWNGDLGILSQDGIVSMRAALQFSRESIQKASITGKIQTLFSQYAGLYRANFGWMMATYPKARYLVVNIPQITNSNQIQLVMNTITGSWCQFEDLNAGCWGVANDLLYFGGNSAEVYQADVGTADSGSNISWNLQTSWQKVKGTENKSFTMVRPTMLVGPGVMFGVNVNVDFLVVQPSISLDALAPSGGMTWAWTWPGTWGGSEVLDSRWQTAGAFGTWSSIHVHGTVNGGSCKINAFDLIGEIGGPL